MSVLEQIEDAVGLSPTPELKQLLADYANRYGYPESEIWIPFRFSYPYSAQTVSVDIDGDNFDLYPLKRNSHFELEVKFRPGIYQYHYRVNGRNHGSLKILDLDLPEPRQVRDLDLIRSFILLNEESALLEDGRLHRILRQLPFEYLLQDNPHAGNIRLIDYPSLRQAIYDRLSNVNWNRARYYRDALLPNGI